MIKQKLKNMKAITLISLTVTISVLMILTGIIINNIGNSLEIKKLEQLKNDVDILRSKISTYYVQYGDIPAKGKYKNINHINSISGAVDTGEFLVIDLSAIENLTLNYGKDYENVKKLDNFKSNGVLTDSEAKQNTDIYIINETSHNIFYVEGVDIQGDIYYTDYTEDEKDTEEVQILSKTIDKN